jgi:hypothetical protein
MQDGRVNVLYSTPKIYSQAKQAYNQTWPVHVGDMFPYADSPQSYWTGAPAAASCLCFALLCFALLCFALLWFGLVWFACVACSSAAWLA